jgi:hypothetical protein
MPTAEENRAAIEAFLKACRQPALLEPGEELIPLSNNYAIETRGARLTLQAWDRTRNLTRRVTCVKDATGGKLELVIERFAKREGQMFLLDLARKRGAELGRRSGRLVFRERFRLFLRRQFPQWKLAELTAEANLEYSLSPAFPRAFVRHGQHGWAALACPPDADPAAALSFALIWLDYLRAREDKVVIGGLAIWVPEGHERAAALRLLCLDPATAQFTLFAYSDEDNLTAVDPRDHGNIDTRLHPCRRPDPNRDLDGWSGLAALPGVELAAKHDGRIGLRVRGLEFAEFAEGEMRFGLTDRRVAQPHHLKEIEALVGELDRARSDSQHALYRQNPEAWLESRVRAEIEAIDASLLPSPIYGQVPAFAAGERGVLDLLAVDRTGRLAVVELKATADLHLPLQALDYWIRVKWHLDRGEFGAYGYFPGIALRREPPRLLLVSPALDFHPTTEVILGYFSPGIDVERIGVGVEWRKGLHVMFRLAGAQRPE